MKTAEEIRRAGLKALEDELGIVDMIRFLQLIGYGSGDYTEERRQWVGKSSVEELVQEIQKRRAENADFEEELQVIQSSVKA